MSWQRLTRLKEEQEDVYKRQSYQDGGSEYTLYIVIGDYSIKFTEWIRISSVGGVTSPESTQITSAVSAEA